MKQANTPSEGKDKAQEPERVWRLADDVVITPVEKLSQEAVKALVPEGELPKGRYGLERKRVRTHPKIVNQDVVDVLQAFGEKGATYEEVLEFLVKTRDLDRDEFDGSLRKLVQVLVHSNFLVDARQSESGAIEPSMSEGDVWCGYLIKENVHCIVDSEIYKVEEVTSGEPRALKVMQAKFPHREMKEGIAYRLRHEFGVISKIKSPYVVKLWESGEHDDRVYGVLDWINGPSVRKYLRAAEEPLGDGPIMEIAIQCAQALHAVHKAGFLHGDVHTGNFLIDGGRVCLVDFGLARPIELTEEEMVRYSEGGVLQYMTPEYVQKEINGEQRHSGSVAGEVYSCGVMLFSLFARSYPYRWKFYREDFRKSILEEPPLSFEECERMPWPALEQVLGRALRKKPQERYGSMAEFIEVLRAVPIPEPDSGKPEEQSSEGAEAEK